MEVDISRDNEIRFKAQLLKSYIMGMFPKSFCKIREFDNLYSPNRRTWANREIRLDIRYLNKMVVDKVHIDILNVDCDLDYFKLDIAGITVGEIKKFATFRNDVVKCCAVPSKLSMSNYIDRLEVVKKGFKMIVYAHKIILTYNIPKKYSSFFRYSGIVTKKEIVLAEKYSISNSEKEIVTKIFNAVNTCEKTLTDKIEESKRIMNSSIREAINIMDLSKV